MERVTLLAAATVALFGIAAISASAQELLVDQTMVYVSDPSGCRSLEDKLTDAYDDADLLTLSFPKGIQALDFQCTFFDVKSLPHNSHLFVDAVCEMPGEIYPDTLSISAYDDKTIQVVSSYDATMVLTGNQPPPGPTTNPGVTMYTSCDILSETPVD